VTSPIGNAVKEYEKWGMDFVVSVVNGSEAADHHANVQKLAMWCIETTNCVDLASSQGGGYWKVLYFFCNHSLAFQCNSWCCTLACTGVGAYLARKTPRSTF